MKKGILIEGCDCSGKSTLVRTLKSRLFTKGWDIVDVGHRSGSQLERYLKLYVNADQLIFDRGHFSEIVYGDLWRDGNHFVDWEKEFLGRYVFEHFVVVRAEAHSTLLLERYSARQYQQIISQEELENVQQRFITLMQHPDVISYNSKDTESLERAVENILLRVKYDSNRKTN